MIKQYKRLATSVLIMAIISAAILSTVEASNYNAKIIKVVDGDTVDAEVSLGFNIFITERFRLSGFDAPETYRPKSQQEKAKGILATKALEKLILNKNVIISTDKVGKYGRWIATIYINEYTTYSVNQYMIDNNHLK